MQLGVSGFLSARGGRQNPAYFLMGQCVGFLVRQGRTAEPDLLSYVTV